MTKLDEILKGSAARPKSGVRGFVVAVINKLEEAGKLDRVNGKSVGTWCAVLRRIGEAVGFRVNTTGLRVSLLEWKMFRGTKDSLYVNNEYYTRNKEKYINQITELRPDVIKKLQGLK